MNRRQKSALLVGTFLVGLAALFPPWAFVDEYIVRGGRESSERSAGYYFFFTPPTAKSPDSKYEQLVIATATRIDTPRLAVEWVAIVLVVAGLLFQLRSQPVSPRRPEGPPVGPNAIGDERNGSVAAHPDANAPTGPPQLAGKPSGERPSPLPKIDPEMIGDLVCIAGYYFEGGVREFAKLAELMVDSFGEGVRPYLGEVWRHLASRVAPSTNPSEQLSEEQKQRLFQAVKDSLEDDQRLRREYLKSAPPLGFLLLRHFQKSRVARRPTVEEQHLMSLARVNSLVDLGLAMATPLREEWLARQNPEDRKELEGWYNRQVRDALEEWNYWFGLGEEAD